MQNILFIGTDFEQYLCLKASFDAFACIYSVSLSDGIRQFNQQRFCLLIQNISLVSSYSGQEELLRSFRRAHSVPIIVLCRDMENSNVTRLLAAGADQVLDIHTPAEILTAYMHTLINRYLQLNHLGQALHSNTNLYIGDFEISLKHRKVFLKSKEVHLSSQEFNLLLFFAQYEGQVLTEEQIFENVWHSNKEFHSSIAKPIHRLRQKIEPNRRNPVYIHTVRGVGYQFVSQFVESCDI